MSRGHARQQTISAYAVGLIFGIGLAVSGMTQPQKVLGFLDLFGAWDPSLIFVMGGSIAVHAITYRLIRRRSSPLFDQCWHVPMGREITGRLLIGSLLFGIGWGLAGYCPGPALVSLSTFGSRPIVFVGSLVVGMVIFNAIKSKLPGKD